MYSKELYEKNKEAHKRAARKYYKTHKEEILLYKRNYYQINKKILNKRNAEYKAKDAKWKEYNKVCNLMCSKFLYPEQIPELEYYGCVSDLNYQIEKGGFIYGSKC